jgi:hypothetical protein
VRANAYVCFLLEECSLIGVKMSKAPPYLEAKAEGARTIYCEKRQKAGCCELASCLLRSHRVETVCAVGGFIRGTLVIVFGFYPVVGACDI